MISGPWPEQPEDPPIPYEEIGRVINAFAILELWVSTLIAKLLNPAAPKPGFIVLEKVDRLYAACEMGKKLLDASDLDPALRGDCKAVLSAALDVNKRRNEVVHSTWFLGRDDDEMVVMRSSVRAAKAVAVNPEKIGSAFIPVESQELKDFADEILELAARVWDVARALPGFPVAPRPT